MPSLRRSSPWTSRHPPRMALPLGTNGSPDGHFFSAKRYAQSFPGILLVGILCCWTNGVATAPPLMMPHTMCSLEEVSAHMCAENYEPCSYNTTIPSTCDPCCHVKISKLVETGANARSDQLMGQDEVDHAIGHSPPWGAGVVTETTLDDEIVEVTASELILLTRPALARSESTRMIVKFLTRISARREAGRPVATDTATYPPLRREFRYVGGLRAHVARAHQEGAR